jgi:hypothetical protein
LVCGRRCSIALLDFIPGHGASYRAGDGRCRVTSATAYLMPKHAPGNTPDYGTDAHPASGTVRINRLDRVNYSITGGGGRSCGRIGLGGGGLEAAACAAAQKRNSDNYACSNHCHICFHEISYECVTKLVASRKNRRTVKTMVRLSLRSVALLHCLPLFPWQ